MARQTLEVVPPEQQQLEGTDHAKVKFVGMGWETLELPPLLGEVTLLIRGTVVSRGEEAMKDLVRKVARVRVDKVAAVSDGELDAARAVIDAEDE